MNTYFDKGYGNVCASLGCSVAKLAAAKTLGIPKPNFKPVDIAKPPTLPTPPVPKAPKPDSIKPVKVKNDPYRITVPQNAYR